MDPEFVTPRRVTRASMAAISTGKSMASTNNRTPINSTSKSGTKRKADTVEKTSGKTDTVEKKKIKASQKFNTPVSGQKKLSKLSATTSSKKLDTPASASKQRGRPSRTVLVLEDKNEIEEMVSENEISKQTDVQKLTTTTPKSDISKILISKNDVQEVKETKTDAELEKNDGEDASSSDTIDLQLHSTKFSGKSVELDSKSSEAETNSDSTQNQIQLVETTPELSSTKEESDIDVNKPQIQSAEVSVKPAESVLEKHNSETVEDNIEITDADEIKADVASTNEEQNQENEILESKDKSECGVDALTESTTKLTDDSSTKEIPDKIATPKIQKEDSLQVSVFDVAMEVVHSSITNDMEVDQPTENSSQSNTKEGALIEKLCSEITSSDHNEENYSQNNQNTIMDVICIDETLNDTFDLNDDSVGATDLNNASSVNNKIEEIPTIVIEDTPLRAKSPKVTMRKRSKKQEFLESSHQQSLNISCVLEKSILKRKKRSLSTGDINLTMHERRVQFHSPANQTVEINMIDERLLKSYNENNSRNIRAARRKRSLSETDSSIVKSSKFDGPRSAFKSKKMPDFKSIHDKQFKKMESIVESVARKQERAILLTTPNSPKVTTSTSRSVSSSKKKQLQYAEKRSVSINISEPDIAPLNDTELVAETAVPIEPMETNDNDNISEEAPQSSTNGIENGVSENENATDSVAAGNQQEVQIVEHDQNDDNIRNMPGCSSSNKSEMSVPFKPLSKIAPLLYSNTCQTTSQIAIKVKPIGQIKLTDRKPVKIDGQKTPVFKFGAKQAAETMKKEMKIVNLTDRMNSTTATTMRKPLKEPHRVNAIRKVTREEEHRSLYKASRICSPQNGQRKQILKGVRTNRRFELQMAFRNMTKDQ